MIKMSLRRIVSQQDTLRVARSERSHDYRATSNGYRLLRRHSKVRLMAKDAAARASAHNHVVLLRYIWNYYLNNVALYRRRRYNEWHLSNRYSPTHSSLLLTHSFIDSGPTSTIPERSCVNG